MMDEIEFQLCLSIDPIHERPRSVKDAENEKDNLQHQQQGDFQNPSPSQSRSLIQLNRKKRSAGYLDQQATPYNGNGNGYYESGSRTLGALDSLKCADWFDGPAAAGVAAGGGEGTSEGHAGECGQKQEPEPEHVRGQYLRLPPRKMMRTSFSSFSHPPSPLSFEAKGSSKAQTQTQVRTGAEAEAGGEKENSHVAEEIPGRSTEGLDNLAASLPDIESLPASVSDALQNPHSSRAGNDTNITPQPLRTNVTAEMDLDDEDGHGTGNSTAMNETSSTPMPTLPPSQPRSINPDPNTIFRRPHPPFAYSCPEAAYMPALIDSLSSAVYQGDQTRRPCRFSIYEDPDGMDIDGVGFFGHSWYISPEDDKENAEGDEEGDNHAQSDVRRSYELGHGRDRDNGRGRSQEQEQEQDYRLPFPGETGPYNSASAVEQRAYHTNPPATPFPAGPTISGTGTPDLNPTAVNDPWTSWSAQIPAYFSRTGHDSAGIYAHNHTLAQQNNMFTSIPTPAPTPSRPDFNLNSNVDIANAHAHEHAIRSSSSTSLSATEVSLRALHTQPQSRSLTSTNMSETHTPNDLEENPRPRRMRRVIRAVNIA